jgi:hypothetical protein
MIFTGSVQPLQKAPISASSARPRNEDAVGTRIGIGSRPAERFIEQPLVMRFGGRPEEQVHPRVEEHRRRRLPGRAQPLHLLRHRREPASIRQTILDVASDGASIPQPSHRLSDLPRPLAIAPNHIDRDRKLDRGGDPLRIGKHQIERHRLPVGIAMRGRDRPAPRRDSLRACAGDRLRTARIPGVEQDQRIPARVQRMKDPCLRLPGFAHPAVPSTQARAKAGAAARAVL